MAKNYQNPDRFAMTRKAVIHMQSIIPGKGRAPYRLKKTIVTIFSSTPFNCSNFVERLRH